jgi:hypothetical protein
MTKKGERQERNNSRKPATTQSRQSGERRQSRKRQSLFRRKPMTVIVDRMVPTTRRAKVVRREPKNGGVIQRRLINQGPSGREGGRGCASTATTRKLRRADADQESRCYAKSKQRSMYEVVRRITHQTCRRNSVGRRKHEIPCVGGKTPKLRKLRNSVCRWEDAEAAKATEFRVSTERRRNPGNTKFRVIRNSVCWRKYGIPCFGGKMSKYLTVATPRLVRRHREFDPSRRRPRTSTSVRTERT